MIRNDAEYKEAQKRLKEEKSRLDAQEAALKKMGLSKEELKRALDPMRSFHLQLAEEIEGYEKLLQKDFEVIQNLHGLGRQLVALRIASGITQRELAERVGVSESQVSRDERNEYHGVSVERASKILDALGVDVESKCLGFHNPNPEPRKHSKRVAG